MLSAHLSFYGDPLVSTDGSLSSCMDVRSQGCCDGAGELFQVGRLRRRIFPVNCRFDDSCVLLQTWGRSNGMGLAVRAPD